MIAIGMGVFVAYVLVLIASLAFRMPLDSPSHFALPAGVALLVYIGGKVWDRYTGSSFSRSPLYPVVLIVLAFLGFLVGFYAFYTTFVLFGAGYPDVGQVVFVYLPLTPYWVVFPAIVGGWVPLLLELKR